MATFTQEVRSVPLWLLRDYLVELGGTAESDTHVVGDQWEARLTELSDHEVGSLSVANVKLELSGDDMPVKMIIDQLETRLARAGGA